MVHLVLSKLPVRPKQSRSVCGCVSSQAELDARVCALLRAIRQVSGRVARCVFEGARKERKVGVCETHDLFDVCVGL